MKIRVFTFLLLSAIAFAPSSLFAQAAEINPYAGYYWMNSNDEVGSFKNNQLLGVRGGGYITKSFELGGNYAWSNHFQPEDSNAPAAFAGALGFPQGKVRANIWEAEFTYNFGKRSLFGSYVRPYVVGGAGGLTTRISDPDEFVLNVRPVTAPCGCTKFVVNDALDTKDTFFTFSYGGGVKWHRVWGPMGFFGDFRGRTMPNFFSHATTWPELSAGLTFSWGER
jgi:Outer membrane protein beta-barrel domain